jgi:GT2 family glycosyltransferase
MKVAVVILNWNGEKFLREFLPGVVSNSEHEGVEIVVADNGSTDDSVQLLRQNFPSVRLILFDKNYGFTGGYNRALNQIDAEYFVLLNSDVEVTPNWIFPIIKRFDEDNSIGAAQPKLLAYHQRTHFEYAGAAGGFIDKFGYPFCRGRIISQIEEDKGQYDAEAEIFWATGACLFVRAEAFRKAGGLDEGFFAHMEEIDLCWRFKNMGYKNLCIPSVKVYHVGGGTLPNNNPRKLYLNYRNNLLLLYKNLPAENLFFIIFTRMLLDGMSGSIYILQGKFAFVAAVFKAHMDFYKLLPNYRKIRKAQAKQIKQLHHPERFKFSIVWKFFIQKKRLFSEIIR